MSTFDRQLDIAVQKANIAAKGLPKTCTACHIMETEFSTCLVCRHCGKPWQSEFCTSCGTGIV